MSAMSTFYINRSSSFIFFDLYLMNEKNRSMLLLASIRQLLVIQEGRLTKDSLHPPIFPLKTNDNYNLT